MNLGRASEQYDRANEAQLRKAIQEADALTFKKRQDVRLENSERLILKSPDGTLHQIKVANDGTLSTSVVT